MEEVYLDNSSTTRPYDEVLSLMNHIAGDVYGNPSSLHTKGIDAERYIKSARKAIADSLSADSENIYFTSGGTEANNLAILGYLFGNRKKGRHIITTKIEHPSVIEVFKWLEEMGYRVDYVEVNRDGLIDLKGLESLLSPETSLISIIHVNNETGVIQPVDEIASIRNRKSPGAVLHIDAVQAYGKMELNPGRLNIDLMSISSHKIHGPKGVGALYVSGNIKLQPILFGGGQEKGIRSGTENVPGICGFGKASEICHEHMNHTTEKVKQLKESLEQGILSSVSNSVVISPKEASPYILNISFPGVKAEVLLHCLEQRKIYVSTGAACHSRRSTGSHVLKAMGLEDRVIQGAIRFSLSSFNTMEQIEYTVNAISEIMDDIEILSK